jgi:hypothetical protein
LERCLTPSKTNLGKRYGGPFFPVLVANVLSPVVTESEVHFKGGETVFYTVLLLLVVYFVSLLFAWPFANRRLSRWCTSIADLMTFFYPSKIMSNSALDISDINAGK